MFFIPHLAFASSSQPFLLQKNDRQGNQKENENERKPLAFA
jgi:hypothetical protein